MKKWIIALVVVLVIGALAALDYASPLWTLRNLQTAARDNDGETVAAHVDFDALRTDLKQELRAKLNAEGGGDSLANTFGDAFVDPLVDAAITPRGVRAIFDARASGAGRIGAIAMPDVGSGDPSFARTGLNSFTVTAASGRGALVFTRAFPFASWRLSGIDLPPDAPPPDGRPDA